MLYWEIALDVAMGLYGENRYIHLFASPYAEIRVNAINNIAGASFNNRYLTLCDVMNTPHEVHEFLISIENSRGITNNNISREVSRLTGSR